MSINSPQHHDSDNLSGRFLRWLANPVRRRKMRSLLRGSLLGICIGNILFVGWFALSDPPDVDGDSMIIIAFVIAFLVSFIFIHLFVCVVALPLYLRSQVDLRPATGALYGGLIGAVYGVLFPQFRAISYFCGGLLFSAYDLRLIMLLEPWHTALIFGTSYGLLVGLCAGILETRAVRLRVAKGF